MGAQRVSPLPGRSPLPPHLHVQAGVEARESPERYDLDGLKRGASEDRPFLVFQYTLLGEGRFETDEATGARATRVYGVPAGSYFTAIVPGAHRYCLPREPGRVWTFFFLTLHHPYLIERVARRLREGAAPVRPEQPGAPLMSHAVALFLNATSGAAVDVFDREAAILQFMVEYDRAAEVALRPPSERDRLLGAVRRQVLAQPAMRLDVSALAASHGLSRSHFTRGFHAATGLTPARYAMDVRIEEARRLVIATNDKLANIARRTGFVDATHLGKMFRRRYHATPGELRRHYRGTNTPPE